MEFCVKNISEFLDRLRNITKRVKHELGIYRAIANDPRTPRLAKMLLLAALAYLLLPFDLIPDWIPVLGLLDDALFVPGMVMLAIRMIPKDVIESHR